MKVKVGFDDREDGTVEVKNRKFVFAGPRPDNVKHFVEFYAEQLGHEAATDEDLARIGHADVLKRMLEQMQGRSWAVLQGGSPIDLIEKKFDPSEARADDGKWTAGGSGGGSSGRGGSGHGAAKEAADNPGRGQSASPAPVKLAAPTAKMVTALHQAAAPKGDAALHALVNKPNWQGPKDLHEVRKALDAAMDKAEVTINFSPHRIGDIVSQGSYRSAYETNTRSKGYMASRSQVEEAVFGAGANTPAADRPKYAAVNWGSGASGAAPGYGGAVVVLNKDALKGRTTATSGNSFGHCDPHGVGTIEDHYAATASNLKALKAAGFKHDDQTLSTGYTEMQIWGDLPFHQGTVKEIRMPSLSAATPGIAKLQEFSQKTGVPIKFYHENDGSEVSFETAKQWSAEAIAKQKTGWLGKIKKSLFGG